MDLSYYHHNSHDEEVDPYHSSPKDNTSPTPSATSGATGSCHSFAVKLHYMLTEVEKDGLSDIVSWLPHGRCFMVHNRNAFIATCLSNWFQQSKFTSFQRQLNIYGFRRIVSGRDKGAYYHKLFLRGKPDLSCFITRTTVKGKGPRKPSSPAAEPDFYTMPPLPPSNNASSSVAVPLNNPYLEKNVNDFHKSIPQSLLYLYQHGPEHHYRIVLAPTSSLNSTSTHKNSYGYI